MSAIQPSEVGRWFEAEAATLVLYARRWFRQEEAEEVVQEAFVRLMQQSRWPEHVRGWLYTTVRNTAISRVRSSSRRQAREERVTRETPAWFEHHPGDHIDARAAQLALEHLPDDEREIVTMRIWTGMTLKEISDVVGSSVPTVFRRYRSALGRLRQEMKTSCTTTRN